MVSWSSPLGHSPSPTRITLEMLTQASKPQPQTSLPVPTGETGQVSSLIPAVLLMLWPSNPQESGWGLVQQGALLYYGPVTSLGPLCPQPQHSQDRKAETQDGSFSASVGGEPRALLMFKTEFLKSKRTPQKRYRQTVSKPLKRPNPIVSEGSGE